MPIRYSSVVGGSSSGGFNLDVGSSGNTTFVFSEAQPAGGYSITSQLADSSIEFYAIAEDGTLSGYTNTKALSATKDFDTLVVYGATTNDLITFEYKSTTLPTASGDQDSGAAPFITSADVADLPNLDDAITITGGNFATNVSATFTGTDSQVIAAKSIVRGSSTEIIVTRPDSLLEDNAPYTLTVSNPNIDQATLVTNTLSVTVGGDPSWDTVTSTYYIPVNQLYSLTIQATDPDGSAITYGIVSGALPTGLTLNAQTGEISGTPTTVESAIATVSATDEVGNTTNKTFTFGVTAVATEDVYSPYLQIALQLNDNFDDTSASIKGSGSNKTVTPVNSPSLSTAQSKFYSASYDSGTESQDKYLSIPNDSSLHITDNGFTIEGWFYCTNNSAGYQVMASHSGDTADQQNGWILITEGGAGTPSIFFYASDAGGWDVHLDAGVPPTLNAWTHIAVTRFYNTWKLFVNGVLRDSQNYSGSVSSPSSREFRLGSYRWIPGNPQSFNGYIQDFRLYNGPAKYLLNFPTPPAMYSGLAKTVSASGTTLPLTYSSAGQPLYINNADPWQNYSSSLPETLRNIPTTQVINEPGENISVTLSDTTTIVLVRNTGWSPVDTSGWTLLETGKTDIITNSTLEVYAKSFAAGTYSLDTLSAMYFFLDCTIA